MLRNENYNDEDEKLDYSFCFIAHPAPVIDFSWRRISKYMPRLVIYSRWTNMSLTNHKVSSVTLLIRMLAYMLEVQSLMY